MKRSLKWSGQEAVSESNDAQSWVWVIPASKLNSHAIGDSGGNNGGGGEGGTGNDGGSSGGAEGEHRKRKVFSRQTLPDRTSHLE